MVNPTRALFSIEAAPASSDDYLAALHFGDRSTAFGWWGGGEPVGVHEDTDDCSDSYRPLRSLKQRGLKVRPAKEQFEMSIERTSSSVT